MTPADLDALLERLDADIYERSHRLSTEAAAAIRELRELRERERPGFYCPKCECDDCVRKRK